MTGPVQLGWSSSSSRRRRRQCNSPSTPSQTQQDEAQLGHSGIQTQSLLLNDGVIMVSSPLLEIPQRWPVTAAASSYFTVTVCGPDSRHVHKWISTRGKKKRKSFLLQEVLYVSIQTFWRNVNVASQSRLQHQDTEILYFPNYGSYLTCLCSYFIWLSQVSLNIPWRETS